MGGGQRRSRRSTLQAWGYYLLALMAWVTIVLVVSVLGFIICRSLIWYETNPLYHLLNWVRDYYFFVFAFVILVGWVVISYYFIARPNQQLQALVEASGQLSQPTEEPIRLPPAMKSVEDQLNLAREEALRAQQAARRQLTICERDIAKAEERIAALEADMEAAACDYEKLNELVQEKEAAQAELDALYERWEQLSEEAEG